MTVYDTSLGPIEVLRTGTGTRRLILLHAAASSPRALFKLASALTMGGADRQALLPALNGYGATSLSGFAADDPFAAHLAVARWAHDAATHDNPAHRPILIGHSMGGLVALRAVLDGLAAAALILYEPIALDCLDMDDAEDRAARAWDGDRVAKLRDGVAAGDLEAGVRAFIEAFNEVAWGELPAPLRSEIVAKAELLAAETRAAPLVKLDRGRLAELSIPVLILQGERSPAVTHRMTLRLSEAMPQASRQVMAGVGHMGPALAPGAVAPMMEAFLQGIE